MIEQYPDMDIQNMRTLIRNARKEKESNKPPKAYREIFRVLKDMDV
jgi:ribosome-associated protein